MTERFLENIDFYGPKKRVARSTEKLASDFRDIAKDIKSLRGLQLFTKKVGFETFTEIVSNNPRLTGYSSNSWTIGESPVVESLDPQIPGKEYGQPVIPKLKNALTYYIKNPLPYILALEAGWSKQSPSGFIANAVFLISKKIRSSKK